MTRGSRPADSTVGSRYLALLQDTGFRRLLASSVPGRLGFAMSTLALILLLGGRPGGLATAGLATGAFAAANAVLAPLRGRAISRFARPALLAMAAGTVLGASVLAFWQAPASTAVLLAVLTGAVLPPVSAVARAAVPERAPASVTTKSAFALDGTVEEVLYVVGPASTALIVPVAGTLLLPGTALLMLVSCCLLPLGRSTTVAPAAGPGTGKAGRLPEWARAEVTGLATAVVAGGLLLGVMTIAVPAAAKTAGAIGSAGILLTCLTAGSAVGGLMFGLWEPRTRGARLAGFLALALCALSIPPFLLPLTGGSGRLVPVGALLAASGLALSPLMVTAFGHVHALLGDRADVAVYAWLSTAKNLAVAAGAAGAGVLIPGAGLRLSVLLAAGLAALVALLGIVAAQASVTRRADSDLGSAHGDAQGHAA